MGMTKFEKVDEPGFVAVAGELGRWCRELFLSGIGGGPDMGIVQQGQIIRQGVPQCTW
jgi:hypothetical protein